MDFPAGRRRQAGTPRRDKGNAGRRPGRGIARHSPAESGTQRKRSREINVRTASVAVRLLIAAGVAVIQARWLWAWAGLDALAVPLALWFVWDLAHGCRSATAREMTERARDVGWHTGLGMRRTLRASAKIQPVIALVLPGWTL